MSGVYIYFAVRLQHIRHHMREQLARMPAEKLACVALSPDDYLRYRIDRHELKINGRMFDVAHTVHTNGMVLVYGLFDAAEDNLLSLLQKVLLRLHQDDEPLPPALLSLLLLTYHLPEHIHLKPVPFTSLIKVAPYQTCYSKSVWFKVPSPPPEYPANAICG